ncbi:hypothetical protein [Xanthomonas citri]|uniref:hypothetical protein n=1 Tax=Xanthomonas citri TaxID=346 RepID=UPI001F39A351|nr:hypothetical protein [Xanthomonas citri]
MDQAKTAADNVRALIADHRRHERACRVHAARLRREAQQLRELPAGGARSLFRAHELARKAIALTEQADSDSAAAALLATPPPALTRTPPCISYLTGDVSRNPRKFRHPSPVTPHPNSNPATSASRSIKLRVGRDSCKKQQKVS